MSLNTAKNTNFPQGIECTVCIVGTGPAGAFLAVELAEQGHDVLIIDSGTDEPDVDIQKSISSVSIEGGASLRFGFSRQFGGASNLWAGRVAPMEVNDFTKWPINFDDIKSFYAKAAKIMGIPFQEMWSDSQYNKKEQLTAFVETLKSVGLEEKKFVWNNPAFRTAQFLNESKKKHTNLKIILGLHLKELQEQANRIKFASVVCDDGKEFKIKSKYFVLAAGGLEIPRILLNSNSKSATGIGNKYGIVGKYLQTHPKADIGILKLNKNIKTNHPLFIDQQQASVGRRYGVGFSKGMLTRVGQLNHYVQLTAMTEYQLQNFFNSAKNSQLLSSRIIKKNRYLNSRMTKLGLRIFDSISRLSNLQRKAKYFVVRGFFDQNPSLENKVELSNEKDCHGALKINIKWKLSSEDKLSIRKFTSELKENFEKTGLGDFESKLIEDVDYSIIGIHSHFIGTTAMGNNPKISVVDPNCKVHDIDNLFISGPSVFTTGGYANPFFTIAALSLRLADHLNFLIEQKNRHNIIYRYGRQT